VVSLIVPGAPVPWARARRNGARYFTAPDVAEYQEQVRAAWMVAGRPWLDGALAVKATFHVQRPRSHFGTGANACKLRGAAPAWPTSRCDVDNLLKAPLDALNGLLFADDAQVVHVQATKRYATDKPHAVLECWTYA